MILSLSKIKECPESIWYGVRIVPPVIDILFMGHLYIKGREIPDLPSP